MVVEELSEVQVSARADVSEGVGRASTQSNSSAGLTQLPWMRGLINAVEGVTTEQHQSGSASDSATPYAGTADQPEESTHIAHGETEQTGDAIQEMFRELGEEQTVFKDTTHLDESCFTLSLLGEARKMQKTGEALAGVKATIRAGTDCERWARSYNLQQGTRFEVSKFSQVYATKLARSWIHRMSFLYALYWNGTKDNPYDTENLAMYVPPQDMLDCLANLTGAARNRAVQVRDITPR
eukprot:6464263-Amphidinium_carterae.3